MKKVLLVGIAVLVISSLSFGQDVMPKIAGGSKALLFTFGGLSNLSANSFDGGIGLKYYISGTMAVRAGLQFASASATTPANPAPGNVGADGKTTATVIGVGGAIEMHMGSGRVSPYIGAGVGFSTTSTQTDALINNVPPPLPSQTVTKNALGGVNINGVGYQGGTSFFVYALAGFEFFLWNEVSLAGEYRLGFGSTARKDQEQTVANVTTTTKGGSSSLIGTSSQGTLTLAVYF